VPVIIEATVGRKAAHPEAAQALIAFLRGPAIDHATAESGMEKGRAGE
jgi:ABC-type Fe3+ transport system substrate-binding protein